MVGTVAPLRHYCALVALAAQALRVWQPTTVVSTGAVVNHSHAAGPWALIHVWRRSGGSPRSRVVRERPLQIQMSSEINPGAGLRMIRLP